MKIRLDMQDFQGRTNEHPSAKMRWASCTPKNNLNFNWRIIKAPVFVIDYLIVHELAHLIEPNHGERFWNIVAVQLPRYALAKDWLREHGAELEEDLK